MKKVSMSGSLRENVGKKDAKALRAGGLVPCVLYGGKEQIHFSIPVPDFKDVVYTPEIFTIDLDIKGKGKYNAILKEVQTHTVNDRILHVDFLEIQENKPVVLSIPVKLTGNAVGVKSGGKLIQKLRKLNLKGNASAIPDKVEVSIDKLDIGQSIKVGDLKIEGVQFLNTPNAVITTVQTTRAVKAEEAAPAKK